MKIAFAGLELPEGKVKFEDPMVEALTEKCKAQKVSPFYIEFQSGSFDTADVIAITADNLLDIIVVDLEKCEQQTERNENEDVLSLIKKCEEILEKEQPLCNADFTSQQRESLKSFGFLSIKPLLIYEKVPNQTVLIQECLEKAGIIFFYTAGPKEVRAWNVLKGSDIVTCAGKIHNDLARGFIKGDIVSFDDYMSCHSFNECKTKGLAKVVGKDYIVSNGDIIEIRFNV